MLLSFFLCITGGGDNLFFFRYLNPVLSFGFILVAAFLAHAFRTALLMTSLPWKWSTLFLGVLLVFHLVFGGLYGFFGENRVFLFVSNNRSFFTMARFHGLLFKKMLGSGQSIALNAMPFVAYFYDGQVYDMLGLVDKTIAHRKLEMGKRVHGHEKGDGNYILSQRPTLIMFNGSPFLDGMPRTLEEFAKLHPWLHVSDVELMRNPRFHDLYEVVNFKIRNGYSFFFKLKGDPIDYDAGDSFIKNNEALFLGESFDKKKPFFEKSLQFFGSFMQSRAGAIFLKIEWFLGPLLR